MCMVLLNYTKYSKYFKLLENQANKRGFCVQDYESRSCGNNVLRWIISVPCHYDLWIAFKHVICWSKFSDQIMDLAKIWPSLILGL